MLVPRSRWLLVLALLLVTAGATAAWWLRTSRTESAPAMQKSVPAVPSVREESAPGEPEAGGSRAKADKAEKAVPTWEPLCQQYCARLRSCNVKPDPECASTCVTVLSAGVEARPYQCVVSSNCKDISNCGI